MTLSLQEPKDQLPAPVNESHSGHQSTLLEVQKVYQMAQMAQPHGWQSFRVHSLAVKTEIYSWRLGGRLQVYSISSYQIITVS